MVNSMGLIYDRDMREKLDELRVISSVCPNLLIISSPIYGLFRRLLEN